MSSIFKNDCISIQGGLIKRYQQTDSETQDHPAKNLTERVPEHRLEVFRRELAFVVDIAQDSAPFIDHFGLLARRASDAHRIVDDDRGEGEADREIHGSDSVGQSDGSNQGDHPGGVAGGHSAGGKQQMPDKPSFKECIHKWLQNLSNKKSKHGGDESAVCQEVVIHRINV